MKYVLDTFNRSLFIKRFSFILLCVVTAFIVSTLGPIDTCFQEHHHHASMLEWGSNTAEAKPKKRKKRYNRRQRAAKKLIEAGHPTVELTLKTDPRVRASVYHGKELLGSTPLRLVWPKDTGALDIKLKAGGYLTVNSRLYTHRNDRVTVKMFKVDQAHLLFGYKKKVVVDDPSAEKVD
jgi:hypothetical protein